MDRVDHFGRDLFVVLDREDRRPLRVQLDSSAVLKLEGSLSFEKLPELLESKRPIVAKAAQRLIQLRKADRAPAPGASLHAASIAEPIVVTLSALDLD